MGQEGDKDRTTVQIAVAMLDALKKRFETKKEMHRQLLKLDNESGRETSDDRVEQSIKRAFREGPKIGLTKGLAEDVLRLLQYDGIAELNTFIRRHVDSRSELLSALHEAFRDTAEKTQACKLRHPDFATSEVFGTVIELRRFRGRSGHYAGWGVPAADVTIRDNDFAFEPEPSLAFPDLPLSGDNRKKWVLQGVEPADLADAADGTATLIVSPTDFATVARCDPSLYDDYGGNAVFELGGKQADNARRAENHRRFGSLYPSQSRIPYCLTLFYTLLLADDKVLFMRRKPSVRYFPNCYEFSGGEQLDIVDMESDAPFRHWMTRACREEYLSRKIHDHELKRETEAALYGNAYLCGLGFDTVTSSFPVFGIMRSPLDEFGFLERYERLRRSTLAEPPDNEGTICIMHIREIRKLIEAGKGEGRHLRTGDHSAFELDGSGKGMGRVSLRSDTLHPMAMYRLALLVSLGLIE